MAPKQKGQAMLPVKQSKAKKAKIDKGAERAAKRGGGGQGTACSKRQQRAWDKITTADQSVANAGIAPPPPPGSMAATAMQRGRGGRGCGGRGGGGPGFLHRELLGVLHRGRGAGGSGGGGGGGGGGAGGSGDGGGGDSDEDVQTDDDAEYLGRPTTAPRLPGSVGGEVLPKKRVVIVLKRMTIQIDQ